MFILLEGEFRSLFRNALERIIGSRIEPKDNKYIEILNKLSIRVICSLIAVYLFQYIKQNNKIREQVTYAFVAIFVYINLLT